MRRLNLKSISFGIAVLALCGVGCQKANDSVGVDSRSSGARAQAAAAAADFKDIQLAGLIYSNDQGSFNRHAQYLLENSGDGTDQVGYVNAQGFTGGEPQDDTGILFGGSVHFANGGPLRSGQNQTIATNSRIVIRVYDYREGETLPPWELAFSHAEGSVSGNTARLVFSDQWGSVQLTGSYDSQDFNGVIEYRNTGGHSGRLGNFSIPTCSIFDC